VVFLNPRQMSAEEKKQQRRDETDRIPIEGKFVNSKRKGTLDRIMAKLADTGLTVNGVGILVMNLDHLLRQLCALIGGLIVESCLHDSTINEQEDIHR
jgi:hypothetical protein